MTSSRPLDQGLDRHAERVVKAEGAHEVELLGRQPGERQADLAGRQHAELDDAPARPRAVEAGHERLRIAGRLERDVELALVGLVALDPPAGARR